METDTKHEQTKRLRGWLGATKLKPKRIPRFLSDQTQEVWQWQLGCNFGDMPTGRSSIDLKPSFLNSILLGVPVPQFGVALKGNLNDIHHFGESLLTNATIFQHPGPNCLEPRSKRLLKNGISKMALIGVWKLRLTPAAVALSLPAYCPKSSGDALRSF